MYKILISALGQDAKENEVIEVSREHFDSSQLAFNLCRLWAWNIRGIPGYEADGEAVFISYA